MEREKPAQLFARHALTSKGWQRDVLLGLEAGKIATVTADAKLPQGVPAFDVLLPGMSNVHSHAFQRAFAGLTEKASGNDNFWSWREAMYHFANTLRPQEVEEIARGLYIGLLKQGYTAVGEFHYLHHDTDGAPYADLAEMSHRIIAAAQDAGIHLTHLPVFYETANVDGKQARPEQRRFTHDIDAYMKLVEALRKKYGNTEGVTIGVAPHSLRAVKPESLKEIITAFPGCPMHIHAAEQQKEVEDCIAALGMRPVEWLLQNAKVDARWCLVHATHMTPEETKALAKSGATAGLCPTTEANLGDGIFSAEAYIKAGGTFGMGSDSNVCLSPFEELRLLEYAQRLTLKKRNVLAAEGHSTGHTLYMRAAAGGAQALGLEGGVIAEGRRADLVALENAEAREGDAILDTLIFAASRPPVTDVFVAGRQVVKSGRHPAEPPK